MKRVARQRSGAGGAGDNDAGAEMIGCRVLARRRRPTFLRNSARTRRLAGVALAVLVAPGGRPGRRRQSPL
jgi:hypothetical protein